ncbi:MAG TPA: hypothetical protein PKV50_09230, partial [Prolixibacteraceae bacterium]|nr:hypothetical protein [Prolixibacteraceae bacterium]
MDYKEIFNHLPVALIAINRITKALSLNKACEEFLGSGIDSIEKLSSITLAGGKYSEIPDHPIEISG